MEFLRIKRRLVEKKNNVNTLRQGSAQYPVSFPAQAVALHGFFGDFCTDNNSSLRVCRDNILCRQSTEAHRAAAL